MQDEVADVWAKFLRESLKNISGDELTMLDEISNGRNDPHDVMEHLFAAVETEMQRRLDEEVNPEDLPCPCQARDGEPTRPCDHTGWDCQNQEGVWCSHQ